MFDDDDRLAMLKDVGAEQFDTGQPFELWALFEGEFNDPELSGIPVEGEITWLECRISDKETHALVVNSRLKRVGTEEDFYVRRLEPSKSSGFLIIRLRK